MGTPIRRVDLDDPDHTASPAQDQERKHRRLARWRMKRFRRLRSAVKAQRAEQAEVAAVEHRERERLSMLVRARAEERQRAIRQRFPHLPCRFIAPLAEVAARPRIDDLATHIGALTYGSFLAIPPLLLFASSVVGFVLAGHPQTAHNAVNELVSLVPGLSSVVTAQVQATVDGRVTFGVIGLLGLLWTASGFASRLRHALGVIFRTPWAGLLTGRVRGTVIGLLMVVAFVALAVFTAVEARLQASQRSVLAVAHRVRRLRSRRIRALPRYLSGAHAGEGHNTAGSRAGRGGVHRCLAGPDGPGGIDFRRTDPAVDRAIRDDRRDLRLPRRSCTPRCGRC